MSERAPSFSFYAKDFLSGVATLSLAARGAYITLLAYQWDHGSVPAEIPTLARICGCSPAQIRQVWPAVATKFEHGADGAYRNVRLEVERQKQVDRRAALRDNGTKGGRPPNNQTETNRLFSGNQNETKRFSKQEPKQNQKESLSFSSSFSSSSTEEERPPAPDARSKRPVFKG